MRIGILTGGGDCPGLNAVIRAIVRRGYKLGWDMVGIRNGYAGMLTNSVLPLTRDHVAGILHKGGTILGTSRTNPYKEQGGEERMMTFLREQHIDALIPIGGEDTLGVAAKLFRAGVNVVGVPKTIDNDLAGTDFTFGFDTAVNTAMEAIDRIHTTAESHQRVIVIEVMGRHTGWIALYAGIAGGADVILVPEHPFTIEGICSMIAHRHALGRTFSLVVVAEGAKMETDDATDKDGAYVLSSMKKDAFGHVRLGGIANVLAEAIEDKLGCETRSLTLGHIQRGGAPTAFDRVLGTRYGVHATELVEQGRFGRMVALQGNAIVDVSIDSAVNALKLLDEELYRLAEVFTD
jgi:6-phosphofructokinase 1